MTKRLIQLFIRNSEQTEDKEVRNRYGYLASLVGIVCNIGLFLGKYTVGWLFGSIAIMADGINNLSDSVSNIVSLLGFKLGSKEADKDHPFGHARYEYIAGLIVCIIVLAIGLSLGKESIQKILHPNRIEFQWVTVAVLIVSIGIKFWMSRFNKAIGDLIDSNTLRATAADSRNDVITTAAVLAATVLCTATGIYRIDGIMGLFVALFILWSGGMLMWETLQPLLGTAPDKELVEAIEREIQSYPLVLNTHDLMIHDYGPGNVFGSIHVEFPADKNILMIHSLIEKMEEDMLKKKQIHLTIHHDPVVMDDPRIPELQSRLSRIAEAYRPGSSVHDIRLVETMEGDNLLFDYVLEAGTEYDREEIHTFFQQQLDQWKTGYHCLIKIEQSYI